MLDFIKGIFGKGIEGFTELEDEAFAAKLRDTSKPFILDVRSRQEHKEEKLHNAFNMDIMMPNFEERIGHMDKDKHYFVYCKSGSRGRKACRKLVKAGFKHIYNLKGGLNAWTGKTV
ncbi:rhodanese-like domain-containing protein [Algivirga pacifica]